MDRLVGIADRTRGWPLLARLGGAGLLLGAALSARFALIGPEPGYPYLTFFAAVLLAAVLFGRSVGLLATAAATVLAVWFFVPPVGGLGVVVMTGKQANLNGRRPDPREVCLLKPFGPPRLAAAVRDLMGRCRR